MASPFSTFLSDVTTTWEALTPPDNTSVTYHLVDGHQPLTGISGDRTFYFDDPIRLEPFAHEGPDTTEVDWAFRAVLRISRAGRSILDMAQAIANETNLLYRALEKDASLASGVLSVVTEPAEVERDEDNGDALITLSARVGCTETD